MGKQAGSARPKEVRAEGRAEGRELELRPWPAPSPPAGAALENWAGSKGSFFHPDSCYLAVSCSLPSFFLALGADATVLL